MIAQLSFHFSSQCLSPRARDMFTAATKFMLDQLPQIHYPGDKMARAKQQPQPQEQQQEQQQQQQQQQQETVHLDEDFENEEMSAEYDEQYSADICGYNPDDSGIFVEAEAEASQYYAAAGEGGGQEVLEQESQNLSLIHI